jgi:hypothetical protein
MLERYDQNARGGADSGGNEQDEEGDVSHYPSIMQFSFL